MKNNSESRRYWTKIGPKNQLFEIEFVKNGFNIGAGDRDRTGMTFRSRDFKFQKSPLNAMAIFKKSIEDIDF